MPLNPLKYFAPASRAGTASVTSKSRAKNDTIKSTEGQDRINALPTIRLSPGTTRGRGQRAIRLVMSPGSRRPTIL
jgi:hypothetical protein